MCSRGTVSSRPAAVRIDGGGGRTPPRCCKASSFRSSDFGPRRSRFYRLLRRPFRISRVFGPQYGPSSHQRFGPENHSRVSQEAVELEKFWQAARLVRKSRQAPAGRASSRRKRARVPLSDAVVEPGSAAIEDACPGGEVGSLSKPALQAGEVARADPSNGTRSSRSGVHSGGSLLKCRLGAGRAGTQGQGCHIERVWHGMHTSAIGTPPRMQIGNSSSPPRHGSSSRAPCGHASGVCPTHGFISNFFARSRPHPGRTPQFRPNLRSLIGHMSNVGVYDHGRPRLVGHVSDSRISDHSRPGL